MDRRYIDRIYLNQPVPADSYLASLRPSGPWGAGTTP